MLRFSNKHEIPKSIIFNRSPTLFPFIKTHLCATAEKRKIQSVIEIFTASSALSAVEHLKWSLECPEVRGDIEAFGPRLRILKPYVKPITAEKRERLKMGQVAEHSKKLEMIYVTIYFNYNSCLFYYRDT